MAKYASKAVELARSWIGKKESDGSHKAIIDIYNAHKPLARGYKVKYTDEWCATNVSAIAIKLGYTDIIPTECGCGEMIKLFQKIGSWVEDDGYTPKAGDIIFYDWDDSGKGDNVGWSDHVGIVEKVEGKTITVIEGNYKNAVGRRNLTVNGRYIRGYGVPKYDAEKVETKVETNETKVETKVDYADFFKKSYAKSYKTTANLHLRSGAGTDKTSIVVMPKNTVVSCYGYYSVAKNTHWLLIAVTVNGVKYTGFCSKKYLK